MRPDGEPKIPHYTPTLTRQSDNIKEDLCFGSKRGQFLRCFHCKGAEHWPAHCKKGNEARKEEEEEKASWK